MQISKDTVLKPGVYFLPNGLRITRDDVTLDGNGALIIGDGFKGHGVLMQQCDNVSVKNLQIERYYHGIKAVASSRITVEHCSVTRTHELAGPDVFLDIWLDAREAYGAGIHFNGVSGSWVRGNDVQHQQNGIQLYGCRDVAVSHNNASFNSGSGIHLDATRESFVTNNVADFCSRIYHYPNHGETGQYHNGADAAGLVMMNASCRNHIAHNQLRGGGDGVFLGGFHKDGYKALCNDNTFEHNDCSWSPNIAFEATFSERNIFRHNKADNCNYGFWLGYSSHSRIESNLIRGNRIAGVAIEHGHHNVILENTFERNRTGVQLWTSAKPAFTQHFPTSAEVHETVLTGNSFSRHDLALHVWTADPAVMLCHSISVRGNDFNDNRIGLQFERVRDSVITGNRIFANVEAGIKLIGSTGVNTDGNRLSAA